MHCHILLHNICTCQVKTNIQVKSVQTALQGWFIPKQIGLILGVKMNPHNRLHHICLCYVKTHMKMSTYLTMDLSLDGHT